MQSSLAFQRRPRMFIINYFLALAIILLSVVKTADLFIQSDKALTKKVQQFEGHTQNLLKKNNESEKGNISLVAAVFTTLLSLTLLFFITKMKVEYREAVYRKESYLCFQFLNRETQKYIKEMALFNWALKSAFIAQSSGVATAEAISLFKALTFTRNLRHLNYLKKLTINPYCQMPETFSFLKNIPFKTNPSLMLLTNIDQTSIIRLKKWTTTYYKNPKGIRLKKSFCLKSEFQIENSFTPYTTYSSKEIAAGVLSSLKCFSGP